MFEAEGEGEAGGGGDFRGTAAGRFEACALDGLNGGLLQFREAAGRDHAHGADRAVRRDVQFKRDVSLLAAFTRALGILGLDAAAGRGRLVHGDARLGWRGRGRNLDGRRPLWLGRWGFFGSWGMRGFLIRVRFWFLLCDRWRRRFDDGLREFDG